jgi:hypothetical protein
MELQNYLQEKGLKSLCDEFNIKINRHSEFNNLVCLKYSQLESPLEKKIVQQCRGIIVDEVNNWEIVSYPYDKFFNYGESCAANLNWETARVYEKLDGSLMTLYYYQGSWRVQSSGTADGSGQVGSFKYNFSQLFWKVWQEKNYQFPQETEYCFMFELMTPYNRIVVRQNNNNLILHGVRNRKTLQEDYPEIWGNKYNWEVVKSYPLQTLEEIITATNALDPMDSEGYIVCARHTSQHFNRIKIKSPQYVAISHLKTGFSTRKLLEIIVTNEGEEFLAYYPEWQDLHARLKTKYEKLIQEIALTYEQYQDIELQKDFANSVKHLPYSGILFALRGGKTESIKQSLQKTSILKLEALLGLDFIELG